MASTTAIRFVGLHALTDHRTPAAHQQLAVTQQCDSLRSGTASATPTATGEGRPHGLTEEQRLAVVGSDLAERTPPCRGTRRRAPRAGSRRSSGRPQRASRPPSELGCQQDGRALASLEGQGADAVRLHARRRRPSGSGVHRMPTEPSIVPVACPIGTWLELPSPTGRASRSPSGGEGREAPPGWRFPPAVAQARALEYTSGRLPAKRADRRRTRRTPPRGSIDRSVPVVRQPLQQSMQPRVRYCNLTVMAMNAVARSVCQSSPDGTTIVVPSSSRATIAALPSSVTLVPIGGSSVAHRSQAAPRDQPSRDDVALYPVGALAEDHQRGVAEAPAPRRTPWSSRSRCAPASRRGWSSSPPRRRPPRHPRSEVAPLAAVPPDRGVLDQLHGCPPAGRVRRGPAGQRRAGATSRPAWPSCSPPRRR